MKKDKFTTWVAENALLVTTVLGGLIGVSLGFCLRPANVEETWLQLISYPGELFTRALQMMILPLIVSSLVVGSASLDAKLNGKIALRTLLYFVLTSFINAVLGVFLVLAIHPGDQSIRGDLDPSPLDERKNTLLDNFLDLGRNIVPNNVFLAFFQQTQTIYTKRNHSSGVEFHERNIVLRDGTNTLGIITFALLFGTVLGTIGDKGKALVASLKIVDDVIMTIVRGVMWITPIGVASLICSKILSVTDLGTVMAQLGLFIGTVCAGIFLYQLVILQVFYFILKRKNPLKFYWGLMPANITAFTTASTAVALPVTFRCMDNLKVDSRIAHFVLPIGATVNKDGTALFVSVASIFIAQMNGISLNVGELITVAVASTAVSIASASVPSAALALMFIVLNAVNVPTADIGLLFAVDWLVDRIRTTNNLLGDCYAAIFVEHFSKGELQTMDNNLELEMSTSSPIISNGNMKATEDLSNAAIEKPIECLV